MIITTVHGTKFKIDKSNKTWERIDKTGDSGNLRSESGTYIEITDPIEVGQVVEMLCEPYVEGTSARLIITSPIKSVEE